MTLAMERGRGATLMELAWAALRRRACAPGGRGCGALAVLLEAVAQTLRCEQLCALWLIARADGVRHLSGFPPVAGALPVLPCSTMGMKSAICGRMMSTVSEAARGSEATETKHVAAPIAGMTGAAFETDARSAITAWSAEAESLFGWSASEVAGRRAVETLFAQGDRARFEDWAGSAAPRADLGSSPRFIEADSSFRRP